MIARAVYPAMFPLIEWLSHNEKLCVINKSEWDVWRQVGHLKRVCEDAVAGKTCRYVAESAIKKHNDECGTHYTFEEVLGMVVDMDSGFMFSDCNEWALFTDNKEAIVFGSYDDIELAAYNSPDSVSWALLWNPGHNVVVVHKSPYKDYKSSFNTDHDPPISDGLERGEVLSYTLPPYEEASLV